MVHGAKLELLEKINYLSNLAAKGGDAFVDDLCNYVATEFELQAVVLFKVINGNLQVMGKSNSAKKSFMRGTTFSCSECSILDTNKEFDINSDTNCEIQISEFVIYESCISFEITKRERGFLKVAKKSPFAKSDSDSLNKISDFIRYILIIWSNARGGSMQVTDTPFSGIVKDVMSEMRTPTNAIVGFTSILSEDNLTSSQSEYVTTIKKNSQNLLIAINDLIEYAKIELTSSPLSVKSVNVEDLVNDVTGVLGNKFAHKDISFSVKTKGGMPDTITIDDAKLRYILSNLLTVSCVTSEKDKIKVKITSEKQNMLRFEISDSGTGFSDDKVNNFFTSASITHYEELRKSNLTMVSMMLVKKYVEMLGGGIGMESKQGKGTTFYFTVSAAGVEAETPQESNNTTNNKIDNTVSKLPKPTPESNKILVIEDDYATSKLLSNYLNKWGYDPTIVSTEEQTFNLIEKEHFLAIILDIELPNANGLQLLKRIKEYPKTKNTPVIVCSVEADEQKAFMMGAVEYFVKPINYNYLVEVLTSYKLRKNSNILCVDDDLPTLNLVKQAIQTAGYNPIAENVSANVMEVISKKDIDLAIVDLDMPHPNGFELIKLIKSEKRFENLPIVIYTGKENYAEDLKKIDGMFEYLLDKRSTNIEDLQNTINSMVSRVETPAKIEEVVEKDDTVVKLLLAEDYKHSQIIVTRLLKKNGFENIVVVENGKEAYDYAKKEKFNLILMDMQMPIMNGFEATSKIRELNEYKNVPIIALTAFAMKGDREKCLDAGATDYIPKPIDSKEFIEKVKYYTSNNNK